MILDGTIDLTPELTRRLCDRRAGIGADGVLRLVRSENDDTARPMAALAPYFMDYRNADGSIAAMCGNGVRVFVRYLIEAGLAAGPDVPVATRGGVRLAHVEDDGTIAVDMGTLPRPTYGAGARVGVKVGRSALELGVDIGSLDVVVLNGYPGSVAATWQRLGRAADDFDPGRVLIERRLGHAERRR